MPTVNIRDDSGFRTIANSIDMAMWNSIYSTPASFSMEYAPVPSPRRREDARGRSALCRHLRSLRMDGYNKTNRAARLRNFMKIQLQSGASKFTACDRSGVLLREKDKADGKRAGELLKSGDFANLEKLIRGMKRHSAERFINAAYEKNSNLRNSFFHCGNCSQFSFVKRVVDGMNVCKECESTAVAVTECGHRTFSPHSVCIHEAESYSSNSHQENRCRQCARRMFYWESDGMIHNVPPPPVLVGQYHSSRDRIRQIGKTILGLPDIGFELEWGPIPKTVAQRDEISRQLHELSEIVAGVEQDGSVSGINGAEIVTHYGSMDVVLAGATKICKVLKGKAISHNTDCCGLHVSISREGLSNLDIARFVVFWNNPKNTRFLVSFARRWSNHYCVQNFDKGNYKIPDQEHNLDSFVWTGDNRYEIVNLCNRHRVEVRAFRGTTNKDMLRRCIALCAWTMAYCKDRNCKKLHYSEFLDWCKTAKKKRGRRQFKPSDILTFAKARGFLKKKPDKPKPDVIIEGSAAATPLPANPTQARYDTWPDYIVGGYPGFLSESLISAITRQGRPDPRLFETYSGWIAADSRFINRQHELQPF